MAERIEFICPTYGFKAWDVMRACITSYWRHTPHEIASLVVIDDGTVGWSEEREAEIRSWCPPGARVRIIHNEKNEGLTPSWNTGLRTVPEDVTYCLVANNDILFVDGWYKPLIKALNNGYSLAGPLSNAPGVTSKPKYTKNPANVKTWIPAYEISDDLESRRSVMSTMSKHAGRVVPTKINGFCMMGKRADFVSGAYDENNVFRPRNDFMPSGRKNPTPLITGNEDEIQHRWSKLGRKFAVCVDSFVFHYRSVTRGPQYRKDGWLEFKANDLDKIA